MKDIGNYNDLKCLQKLRLHNTKSKNSRAGRIIIKPQKQAGNKIISGLLTIEATEAFK